MIKEKATLVGLTAVFLWSTLVGFTRTISEGLGPLGGGALMYTLAFLLLLFTVGFPPIRSFNRSYLTFGSLLFSLTAICQFCSIGYAHSSRQVIEISMINYLWPCLIIVFGIIFNGQKATLILVPGLALTLTGVSWVIGGSDGFSFGGMFSNIKDNPFSYSMALLGALVWATYTTITNKTANGQNGVTFFFLVASVVLWGMYLAGEYEPMHFDFKIVICLLLSAVVLGIGYAAWNVGILHGNVSLLATASYFIPVFSSAFSSAVLSVPLHFSFWKGAILVCIGSMLCWVSTKKS